MSGWRILGGTFIACSILAMAPAHAIDAIVLEVEEISAPGGWQLQKLGGRLELRSTGPLLASATVATAAGRGQRIGPLSIRCPALMLSEPRFACRDASVDARLPVLGALGLRVSAQLDSDTGQFAFSGSDATVAGGRVSFRGRGDDSGWDITSQGEGWTLPALRQLVAPWLAIPESVTLGGRVSARVRASLRAATQLDAEVQLSGFELSNAEGTIVAEQAEARAGISMTVGADSSALELRLSSSAGQALVGPVLLDLRANPLELTAHGRLRSDTLEIEAFQLEQAGLLRAHGAVTLRRGAQPEIARARLDVEELRFPAAYTSFLQIALAATEFGALRSSGHARGSLTVEDSSITGVDLELHDLDLADTRGKFFVADVNGAIHWIADGSAAVEPSHLGWSGGGAYGLSGGAAEIGFTTHGRGFALLRPARLPVFDGAVAISALAVREFGLPEAEFDFDAQIEPIGMPHLSRAFGWPELSGQLSGRIPALEYRRGVLTVGGDIVARVFDGTITGSNFRLQDPLGPWPRLYADVRAHSLDLGLITQTFPIGTITGRLEGHLLGLELFAWSPVAFDALLRTPPGDRTSHRISARAVGNLANIGGGGGSVMQALQSGALRFFDEYRYAAIGIRCRLRDDVCLMGGIEPAGVGYYIVKGRGLPRIDIVGNTGRVNWRQLVSQVVAAMESEGLLVR